MDIWMTWCRRKAKCKYCEEDITIANPMVTGKLWRKGDSRKYNIRFYWHPQCWIKSGGRYLKENPYVSKGNRGRKRLDLTPEEHALRIKLLKSRGSLEQRKRKLKAQFPDKELYVTKINIRLKQVAKEIAKVGGVPKTWNI
jgi:hypothetical protein